MGAVHQGFDLRFIGRSRVEPFMYRLGEAGVNAERPTGTFIWGLIEGCPLCRRLSTLPPDFDWDNFRRHFNINGEKWNAIYARHPNTLIVQDC